MLVDWLLIESAHRRPEKAALVHGGLRATYGEILEKSKRLASALHELGLRRGDRVMIALENSIEYLVSYFGVLQAGCAAVPINMLTTPQAFYRIVADCAPKMAITKYPFFKKAARDAGAYGIRFIITGGSAKTDTDSGEKAFSLEECLGSPGSIDIPGRGMEDLASIIYTSGTTGEPKGVMLSHTNLSSNTRSIVDYLSLTENDSIMVVLPFFYSYGNSLLLTHVMQGGTIVVDNRFIYPNVVLDGVCREEVTGFAGVPSTFAILCHRSNFRNISLPALRYMTQAGGPMPHSMAFEILKAVPHVKLYIMYGQTEASARLSYLPPEDLHRKSGSVGKAVPGVTLEVLNENGKPVRPGEVGEIVASGDNIMMGYWGNPSETAKVIRDNRLYTGDMATVDDEGYIYIVSRKKELIKSGAHRIAPREIEEVILTDPNVFEAAVVGKDDPILGEAICAFVVLKDGHTSTENDIRRICHEHLPLFKVPKDIRFMKSLPKTDNMKVKKEELKKIINH